MVIRSQSPIHLLPVPRSDDDNYQAIVLDGIDDTVGADADALIRMAAGVQLAVARREGILS